jgi:hypothetical protein
LRRLPSCSSAKALALPLADLLLDNGVTALFKAARDREQVFSVQADLQGR